MYRNPLGQFAASYWASLSRNQKQMAVFMLCLASFVVLHFFIEGTKKLVGGNQLYAIGAEMALADTLPVPPDRMDVTLAKIADCESGIRRADGSAVPGSARQFYEDGKVVKNFNRDRSVDIGMWQINSVHIVEVARQDIDVFTEEGNRKFAEHLYQLNGTRDWKASQSCWDR